MNFRFELPIRTERNLHAFVQAAFGVKIPNVQVCPGHSTPWRAFSDCYFARAPVVVVKGSRGFAGKSFLMAVLGMTQAVTLAADNIVLGGSKAQSDRVLATILRLWNKTPLRDLFLVGEAASSTRLSNGAVIKALPASQKNRGEHPPRLLLDEADEMDQKILEAALGMPMPRGGVQSATFIGSTHHHKRGTFTEVLAEATRNRWPVHEICYRESLAPHGWLDPAAVERAKDTMPSEMFRVEVELQQPSVEGRVFSDEVIDRMFDPSLGRFGGGNGEACEVGGPAVAGPGYTGADWGRKRDYTVFVTFREGLDRTLLCVYWKMQRRRPWPVMINELDVLVRKHPGRASHDATGMGGDVVSSLLKTRVEPFQFVGKDRETLLNDYIQACEQGRVRYPMIRAAWDAHAYVTWDDIWGPGHLPDEIAAGALAFRASRRRSGAFAVA